MATKWSSLKRTAYEGIRRYPDGRFMVQARMRDGAGKNTRKQESLAWGTTLDQAIIAKAELGEKLRREIHLSEGREAPTLTDYGGQWLKRKKREKLRDHTIEGYIVNLERHILPFLGHLKVDEITSRDVLLWKDAACSRRMSSGKPYSGWTMASWFSVLRNIMSDVVIEFELSRNPTVGIRAPKKRKAPRRERTLTVAQLREFLELNKVHCNQHFAIALTLAVFGLRWEEGSALHDEHIDEAAGELHVVQVQVRKKVFPTKNENHKVLPLDAEVLAAIRAHQNLMRMRGNPGTKRGMLFPSVTGTYRLPSSVSKGWKVVSRAMNLGWTVTPHDLRRTYQNLLRQASVSMVVQQALMGHSSDAMTQHYSSVNMQEKRHAQAQVVELLKFREAKDGAK